jgi:hypothetical protein
VSERGPSGYTPIPGSAKLTTGKVGQDAAAAAEALAPSSLQAVEVEGHTLGRVLVRERFVPVLADVFDRLALQQEPLEQVVYAHLYRLAVGEERNWCRVSRSELGKRTRLSDRRLMKALAGLVDMGHIALVSRDRRGTLYRVLLPHEVLGEAGEEVMVGRAKAARAQPRQASPARPSPAATRPRPRKGRAGAASVGSVAAEFIAAHGERPGRMRADVVDEILGRLEEGRSFDEIRAELQRFARSAPKTAPLSALRAWLETK